MFPADLTSIAVAVATQATGTVLIFEKMFENRLVFTDKLVSMGARIILCDPHRAVVTGPAKLYGERMESPDIRAGMAMLIASLVRGGHEPDRQRRPDRPRLRAHRRAPARRWARASSGSRRERRRLPVGAAAARAGAHAAGRRHASPSSLLSGSGAPLPLEHARLLSLSNGLDAYGGYFRVFGVGPWSVRDMRRWNAPDGWRRAWGGRGRRLVVLRRDRLGRPVRLRRRRRSAGVRRDRLPAGRVPAGGGADRGRLRRVPARRVPARTRPARATRLTVAARERFGDRMPLQLTYVPSLLAQRRRRTWPTWCSCRAREAMRWPATATRAPAPLGRLR